jgi:hypothetical protein
MEAGHLLGRTDLLVTDCNVHVIEPRLGATLAILDAAVGQIRGHRDSMQRMRADKGDALRRHFLGEQAAPLPTSLPP